MFPRDVACQTLLKSADVSHSYSINNKGTSIFETLKKHTESANLRQGSWSSKILTIASIPHP